MNGPDGLSREGARDRPPSLLRGPLRSTGLTRTPRRTGIRLRTLALGTVLAAVLATSASAAPAPAPYFNGFENASDVGTAPYTSNDAMHDVDRVASYTNGVTSAAGDWHAEARNAGSMFTRYGGYSSVFPAAGYTTSVDFYLDTADSPTGQGHPLRLELGDQHHGATANNAPARLHLQRRHERHGRLRHEREQQLARLPRKPGP